MQSVHWVQTKSNWTKSIGPKMTRTKIASLGRQEPQPTGTTKWPTTLRFGKILGTTSFIRSVENPQDVLQKIHRP